MVHLRTATPVQVRADRAAPRVVEGCLMPFHLSPLTALYDWLWRQPLAMSGGLPVVRLLPDPEPEPVTANDADGKWWSVIAFGVVENLECIEHIVFGRFPTHDEAAEW